MNNQSSFNLNSLKWVKQEIDASLTAARGAIEAYAADSSQKQHLDEALAQLTDALGTLDIAEIHGGALLAREIRDVLAVMRDRPPELHLKDADTVSRPVVRGIIQLSDYLDYIEAGNPDVPVVLVNAINDLRLIRHAELISDGLGGIPGLENDGAILSAQPHAEERIRDMAGVARHVFELGLLGWYRKRNVEASLNKMSIVCRRLKNASRHHASRRLWWVSEAIVSGLRSNVLPHSYSLKFLVGRIDRQIKHLQKVGDEAFAADVSLPLVRSMLYYVASAHPGDAVVDEVRSAYFPEADEEGALAAARISVSGQNAELYRTLAGAMQEKVGAIKDALELHVLAKDDGTDHLADALQMLRELAQTLQMLGMRNQQAFVLDHVRALEGRLARNETVGSDEVARLAEMLLGVESAVQAFSVVGPNFVATVDRDAGGDTEVQALVADEEFRQIRGTVIRESQENLEKVKTAFQQYLTNPNLLTALESVPSTLGQVSGAMLLVSEDHVSGLLDAVSQFVQQRRERGKIISPAELEHVAEAISAVDVYLEILDTSGIQQALYLDKGMAAVALLDVDADVEDADPTRMFESDALLDDPARLFNPGTLIVDFDAVDEAESEAELPAPTPDIAEPVSVDEAEALALDEEPADESMIFEAATLTIAGIDDEGQLDILDIASLDDDEPPFAGRQEEEEEAEALDDPFSASQLMAAEALVEGADDEELLEIDLDQAEAAVAEAEAPHQTEPAAEAETPEADAAPADEVAAAQQPEAVEESGPEREMAVESAGDNTEIVDLGAMVPSAEELSEASADEAAADEEPADRTQPISGLDVSAIASAFEDAEAEAPDAVESVEPPTLTISGIEVEELTSLDEEAAEMAPFPSLSSDEASTEVGEELDTLAAMEIDDGFSRSEEPELADVVGDEDSVQFDVDASIEGDIGTASAFLFPEDSMAASVADEAAPADDEDEAPTGAAVLPEEVEPLSEMLSEDLPEETGVRKLMLDDIEGAAVGDVTEAGDGEALTLVDILPDDEIVEPAEEEAVEAVAGADEADEAIAAEPEGAQIAAAIAAAAVFPACFDGLSVLKEGADEEIIEIFEEEFAEETAVLESHFPQWRDDQGNRDALVTLRRSFHTLKGSARLVGAEVAGEFAWLHEKLLNEVIDGARVATPEVVDTIGAGISLLPRLLEQLQGGGEPDAEVVAHAVRIDALLSGAAEKGEAPQEQPVEAEPPTLISAQEDPALMAIFAEETRANLERLDGLLRQFDEGGDSEENRQALLRAVHTLNGSARTAKVPAVHEPSAVFEHHLEHKFQRGEALTAEEIDLLRDLREHVGAAVDEMLAERPAPDAADLVGRIEALAERAVAEEQPAATEPAAPAAEAGAAPAVSRELVEVFLDESEEILEHCDGSMQRWQQNPDDMELVRELYRELHTLKGSARMAGLESIGDLSHAVETLLTAVDNGEVTADKSLFTVVFGALDRFGEMTDRIRAGGEPEPADALIELMSRIQQGQQLGEDDLAILKSGAGLEADKAAPAAPVESPQPRLVESFESHLAELMPRDEGVGSGGEMLVSRLQDAVKVSPELLDQFVDSVGEINILNSRVEQQVSAFGFNLQELERTISRLTEQLRQLEMEAEAQILSHFDGHRVNPDETGINEYFDPLELDRYSTIQQLSRALAESTDDLVSLHQLLSEERRDVENLLQQEARVGNSLQEALMRTRMSPFKVMGPRLRRVVRGVALELGKEVDFNIVGEEQELDRKVLEGMVVPLEHLLRNALAHGIETPEARLEAGKPEAGSLTVTVERDGPEVVIEVADDGAGIDREAVRRRAIEKGIISDDAELTDAEIHALILHPGFSTATEISQISGRGVGMDVVQEQLRHLNGLLEIASTEGEGTTFRIRLPFTMAINQSLLVRVGTHSYAVPINTVEGVVQVSDRVLAEKLAEEEASIEYGNGSYRLYRLDEVLENARLGPFQASDETRPVLLVGSGDHAIALVVDEIQGNQDVVVKPIGGLLNSVPGLGGATILGDGRVVLILDTAGVVRAATGQRDVIDIREARGADEPERRPTIMVVDDSITIRRVTEKMLERHHFNVVTAKDGLDALAQLEEVKPDVMLLDIEMPRMDGFELAAHLQASEQYRDIPVVMISSRTGKKHRERAAGLGVREFLGKPYQDSELLSHIEALLAEKEGMKRHVG